MDKVEFMWGQKRYKDLLDLYLKIQVFAPNFRPLQKKIEKAYNQILKEEKKVNESKITKVATLVYGYIETKNYQEALDFIYATIKTDPNNSAYQKILIETKRKIIDLKLKENKSKFASPNIPEIYDFIKKLYDLEPSYFKIQKLLTSQNIKLKQYYKVKENEYIKDAELQIKVLYNEGNYQKSLQACKDLLRTKQTNKFAQKYYRKNLDAIEIQNFKTAYKLINN